MSHSQRHTPVLEQLCSLLVKDYYGDLAHHVFTVLARYGRQTLANLTRESYLDRKAIKAGLVVLIQQHLIFHSSIDPRVAYYEINWQRSYALVRAGSMLKLGEDRFGQKGVNVLANVVYLGHTRISDLREAYFPSPNDPSDSDSDDEPVGNGTLRQKANGDGLTNGNTPSQAKAGQANGLSHQSIEPADPQMPSLHDFYATINTLMRHGWLVTFDELTFLSPDDLEQTVRIEAIADMFSGKPPLAAKDKALLEEDVLRRRRLVREKALEVPAFKSLQSSSQAERKRDDDGAGSNKRPKLDMPRTPISINDTFPEDKLVVGINYEKVNIAMRTEQLTRVATQRIGHSTGQVYGALLYQLEKVHQRCWDEWSDPAATKKEDEDDHEDDPKYIDPKFLISTRKVAEVVDESSLDLFYGLDPKTIARVMGIAAFDGTKFDPPLDPHNLSRDQKVALVAAHCSLLARDPFHFVTWHSKSGNSQQYHVEFDEVVKACIQLEIEKTIQAQKGPVAVSVIRALKRKGRISEQQVALFLMQPLDNLRGLFTDMFRRSYIQTQEVPRVERREAKLSMHFMWYDQEQVRDKLLQDVYKAMGNFLQRLESERDEIKELLTKAERTDVVGNEARYLSHDEIAALKKWKGVEEKILLQLHRMDELVAMLRDFAGPLGSP
ncbi:DNA directed RNA polymeras-like protein III subunit Rpc82 [Polyplosphaeria fusca]|uniref:DNA-directed RNA polymerase III subunit RPC3 n=1 Tax=Polyplosphaeria fusca TaxID=682080 RepID=A0A9P4V0P1_9PLEO|nr:DNA directed RNA polymeras-like protein III subunit Rpc82 [Polyplosphaeria fusca]